MSSHIPPPREDKTREGLMIAAFAASVLVLVFVILVADALGSRNETDWVKSTEDCYLSIYKDNRSWWSGKDSTTYRTIYCPVSTDHD